MTEVHMIDRMLGQIRKFPGQISIFYPGGMDRQKSRYRTHTLKITSEGRNVVLVYSMKGCPLGCWK